MHFIQFCFVLFQIQTILNQPENPRQLSSLLQYDPDSDRTTVKMMILYLNFKLPFLENFGI